MKISLKKGWDMGDLRRSNGRGLSELEGVKSLC